MIRRQRKPMQADPDRRLSHETTAQWKLRLAIDRQMARNAGEPLIPLEAEAQADYGDGFIVHVETNTKAWTKRNRTTSPIATMHERGQLTAMQFAAAGQIAFTAEAIERAVSVKCASMEARVDHSGSGRDVLVERLAAVRREQTYTLWRRTLPTPKRLVLDMVLTPRSLVATARVYNVPWRRARMFLLDALDRWSDIEERVWRDIDIDYLNAAIARLERYWRCNENVPFLPPCTEYRPGPHRLPGAIVSGPQTRWEVIVRRCVRVIPAVAKPSGAYHGRSDEPQT